MGYAKPHIALLGLKPESFVLQIRQESTACSVIGVGDVVAALRPLPSHLANLGHELKSLILLIAAHETWTKSGLLYQHACR